MATITQGVQDEDVAAFEAALGIYVQQHPGASAAVFRQNPGSIRIRIIDDSTVGMTKSRRHAQAWSFLRSQVGEDRMGQVSILLVLPTSELKSSLANLDFEDPLPSQF
jgi:hypothetical protein